MKDVDYQVLRKNAEQTKGKDGRNKTNYKLATHPKWRATFKNKRPKSHKSYRALNLFTFRE
jgi:hypothetical protein